MIIAPTFIWQHLPKTGGTSTASLFRNLSLADIAVDCDNEDTKHDSFDMRINQTGLDITSKKIFITLRQLPSWLISDWHHKTNIMGLRIPFEPVRSGLFYSLRLGGTWVAADYWLHYFSIDRCDSIIRLEYIEEDANRLVHPLLPQGSPYLRFPRYNTNSYSPDIGTFFHHKDLTRIYTNNPLWHDCEKKVYGHIALISRLNKFHGIKWLLR